MKRWVGRMLGGLGIAALALIGYGSWRFGHPTHAEQPALASGTAPSGGVTPRFFGTTTLTFDDGHDAVMVDALLSRPGLRKVLFGKIASDGPRIDDALRQARLSHLDLLLVSHTHYDHALDAAAVAQRTGATVIGSPSTREVAVGGGVPPARIVAVAGGETLNAGGFTIRVFRSLHSLGDAVPGEVTAPLRQSAPMKAYKEGGTYSFLIAHRGVTALVHASANVVPGMYRGVHADIVFLATGGLSAHPAAFTERYWREVVEATGGKLVVPIHWDDFFQPLDHPLQPLRRFMDDVPLTMRRLAPLSARDHVAIRYMPVAAPVDIGAAARAAGG